MADCLQRTERLRQYPCCYRVNLMRGKRRIIGYSNSKSNNLVGNAKSPIQTPPTFRNEDDEAKWWARADGREFLKQKSVQTFMSSKGSSLVAELNRPLSVQIALRLSASDLAKARQLAERKGIGYQTLLKMLVHEGLSRESRRK